MDYLENSGPPPPIPERSAARITGFKPLYKSSGEESTRFHSAGSERSISCSSKISSWSSGSESQEPTTETSQPSVSEPSVSEAKKRESQLAPWVLAEIESQVVKYGLRNGTYRGPSNLADLMIAEINAEIENLKSHSGDVDEEEVGLSHSISQRTDWDKNAVPKNVFTKEMVLAAKDRIQQFESTPAYRAYARDREFCAEHSRKYSLLRPERAEKRMAAFESTESWRRYLGDLQVVLGGDEDGFAVADQKLRDGAAWEGESQGRFEEGGEMGGRGRDDGEVVKRRKRVTGNFSMMWKALGVKERDGGGMFGSGAFGL